MSRTLSALLILSMLAACDDTNPFMAAEVEVDADMETDVDLTDGDTDADNIYATDLNADLTMNSFEYDDNGTADPSDDLLLVNNIPFDNSDISGGGYTASATTIASSPFDVYESGTGGATSREYFAIFQRSTYSEVAAVGTGDYVSFGFGGATAQRLSSDNGIPAERPAFYTFTGDYAAVRVTTDQGGSGDVEYITGDAELYVDILDFDVSGAVEGIIDNRVLFDADGNEIGELGDYISLATADIDFDTGVIGSSTAFGLEGTGQNTAGDWQGIFAGPNGEEIAGFVVLEGATTSAEVEDTVRETGVFIVGNTE